MLAFSGECCQNILEGCKIKVGENIWGFFLSDAITHGQLWVQRGNIPLFRTFIKCSFRRRFWRGFKRSKAESVLFSIMRVILGISWKFIRFWALRKPCLKFLIFHSNLKFHIPFERGSRVTASLKNKPSDIFAL